MRLEIVEAYIGGKLKKMKKVKNDSQPFILYIIPIFVLSFAGDYTFMLSYHHLIKLILAQYMEYYFQLFFSM